MAQEGKPSQELDSRKAAPVISLKKALNETSPTLQHCVCVRVLVSLK